MTDEDMASTRSRSATSLELASRNTGLAVQRTRMNADRTLMSVIRTSLSLVSFGFTISQIFQKLTESKVVQGDSAAGHRFGIALVLVGILMLVVGMLYHLQFMLALRRARRIDRGWSYPWRKSFSSFAHGHNRGDPSRDQRRGDLEHGLPHRPVLTAGI
jgi:putative membrane protein